jgi:hypothetical protein
MVETNSYEVTFDTTPTLARQAARYYIWRRAGIWLVLTAVFAIVLLAIVFKGDRSWPVIAGLTLACLKLYLWIRFYFRADEPFRGMKDPKVTAHFDLTGMKMGTDQSKGELSWTLPIRVWRFRPLWIFSVYGSRVYTFIPTEVLPEQLQRFIEQKVAENGGTVA